MKKIYWLILLFLGLHFLILSMLQFTAWPEMVSFPYLINHGFITYKDMVHAYPPLLINVLAFLYNLFGFKILVLKIFGSITILAGDVLLFIIIKKLTKKNNLAAVGCFIYIILQPVLDGNMVWPDLFIVPFLLLTFLLLLKKKYLMSGIAIGLAILTKQTGILFLGFVGLSIVLFERKWNCVWRFVLGVGIIIVPFLVSLISQNSFSEFINWAIIYPSRYWTKFPGYVQLNPTLRENLDLLILFLPLCALVLKVKKKMFYDKNFLILFGFLICGIVGVYPRFSFFHFQPALPFLVIIYIYLIKDFPKKYLYTLFLIPLFIVLINFRSLQFGGSRFWSESDLDLGRKIQAETNPNEPVYLLGLDSSMYAFSNRLPNKPWLDNFGWYLEIPGVQEEVVNALKKDPPEKIFWQTPNDGNWFDIGAYQPKMITDWIRKNYNRKMEIQKGIWEWVRR